MLRWDRLQGAEIVVAATGSDSRGDGSWQLPFRTLTKAFAHWSATRHTIIVLPGEYAEAATLTWPSISGLSLIPLGKVTISNADAATQVILISPTYTASTFEATLGRVHIDADTQIGLAVRNANMTKKLNLYLPDGLDVSMDTSGDSVDIAGTVAGQAIRVYADGPLNLEGLFHATFNDAGSRIRVNGGGDMLGGFTGAGAVAAELLLKDVTLLTGGLTVDGAWRPNYVGCVYATDADPRVYTEFANTYDT